MPNNYILNPNYTHKFENMIEVFPNEGYARVYFQNKQWENIGHFIVDIEDLPIIKRYKWHKNFNFEINKTYIENTNKINLINFILELDKNIKSIHTISKNGNELDFRKNNLEIVYFTKCISIVDHKDRFIYQLDNRYLNRTTSYSFGSKYLDEVIYSSYIFNLNYSKNKISDDDLLELKKFSKFIPEERKKEIEQTLLNRLSKM